MKFQNFFKFLFFIFVLSLTCTSFAKENINDRFKKLTLELRCMTCQNQSVYESDSDFANFFINVVTALSLSTTSWQCN